MPPVVRARAGSARQNRLNTMRGLAGPQADAVVADGDRDGVVVRRPAATTTGRPSQCSMALTTRLRSDPLDPPRVDLGDAGRPGAATSPGSPGARPAAQVLHDPVDDHAQVDRLGLEDGRARVEPADLEQVGEQRLEPVELGLQELGGLRPTAGSKPSRASCMTSAGHPHAW